MPGPGRQLTATPIRSVTLTERHKKFVETLVSSGRFEGESEALRAGLELLKQSEKERELKLQMLSQAIESGVKDLDAWLEWSQSKFGQDAAARAPKKTRRLSATRSW